MTPADLLSDLRSRRVAAWVEGETLRLKAPPGGVLTPELVEDLRQHKAGLLEVLRQCGAGALADLRRHRARLLAVLLAEGFEHAHLAAAEAVADVARRWTATPRDRRPAMDPQDDLRLEQALNAVLRARGPEAAMLQAIQTWRDAWEALLTTSPNPRAGAPPTKAAMSHHVDPADLPPVLQEAGRLVGPAWNRVDITLEPAEHRRVNWAWVNQQLARLNTPRFPRTRGFMIVRTSTSGSPPVVAPAPEVSPMAPAGAAPRCLVCDVAFPPEGEAAK